jgi:hypothetical protein
VDKPFRLEVLAEVLASVVERQSPVLEATG